MATGAVHVFQFAAVGWGAFDAAPTPAVSNWTLVSTVVPPAATAPRSEAAAFGAAVALEGGTLLIGSPGAPATAPPTFDFEEGWLRGWVAVGAAFEEQPTLGDAGDTPGYGTTVGPGEPARGGAVGRFWVNSFLARPLPRCARGGAPARGAVTTGEALRAATGFGSGVCDGSDGDRVWAPPPAGGGAGAGAASAPPPPSPPPPHPPSPSTSKSDSPSAPVTRSATPSRSPFLTASAPPAGGRGDGGGAAAAPLAPGEGSPPRGGAAGDGATGSLTSAPFRIAAPALSFLIGGGCDAQSVYVELLVDGVPARRSTGACATRMHRTVWGLAGLEGRVGRLVVVDAASGGAWGHISVDDFQWEGAPAGAHTAAAAAAELAGGAAYVYGLRPAGGGGACTTPLSRAGLSDGSAPPCAWTLEAALAPPGGRGGERFGSSAAVDGASGVALLGAPRGAVFAFLSTPQLLAGNGAAVRGRSWVGGAPGTPYDGGAGGAEISGMLPPRARAAVGAGGGVSDADGAAADAAARAAAAVDNMPPPLAIVGFSALIGGGGGSGAPRAMAVDLRHSMAGFSGGDPFNPGIVGTVGEARPPSAVPSALTPAGASGGPTAAAAVLALRRAAAPRGGVAVPVHRYGVGYAPAGGPGALQAASGALHLRFATSDGTAVGAEASEFAACAARADRPPAGCGDYVRAAGELVFPPGVDRVDILLTLGEAACAGERDFLLQLYTPGGAPLPARGGALRVLLEDEGAC